MQLVINTTIDLPPDWRFGGLWYANYTEEPGKPWTADAELIQPGENGTRDKVVLSVSATGASAQEAIENLPSVVNATIESIVNAMRIAGLARGTTSTGDTGFDPTVPSLT